jgi:hypothetical protein
MPYNPGHRVFRKLHGYMAPVLGLTAEIMVPAAARLKGASDASFTDLFAGDQAPEVLKQVIEHIGLLVSDDAFAALIEETFPYIIVDGKPLTPEHFSPPGSDGGGRMRDYDQVVGWSVWMNFGKVFFDGVGTFGTMAAKLAAQPPIPKTSNPLPPGSSQGV